MNAREHTVRSVRKITIAVAVGGLLAALFGGLPGPGPDRVAGPGSRPEIPAVERGVSRPLPMVSMTGHRGDPGVADTVRMPAIVEMEISPDEFESRAGEPLAGAVVPRGERDDSAAGPRAATATALTAPAADLARLCRWLL